MERDLIRERVERAVERGAVERAPKATRRTGGRVLGARVEGAVGRPLERSPWGVRCSGSFLVVCRGDCQPQQEASLAARGS